MTTSHRQLSKFAAIFAGGTMISRVTGLVSYMVIARTIAVASQDAFIVAFRLPNMLRDLVGEGAMNAAFVPVLSESAETQSEESFRELVSAAMSAMLVLLAALTVLGVFIAPALMDSLDTLAAFAGSQVPPGKTELMASLTRWTFPYLFFIGMTVFAMGPLFTVKHYSTPSWSPALLNVTLILSCLCFRNRFSDQAYALVLGVWLGGVAQLVVQYIALGRHTGVWWPNFRLACPGVRKIFWLLGPVLIGQATGEVNKLVDMLFAASLPRGTVAALFYANRLVQLPLSIFGLATAAAILPAASRLAARGDFGEIRRTLLHGLRQTCFLTLPAMFGLLFFGRPIVRLLFENGTNFTVDDTQRTFIALAFYGAGLLSFGWVKVAVSGFYAVQDTRTPVIVATLSMGLNIVLILVLVRPMGFAGLAAATSLSYTVNFAALYVLLCRRFGVLWDGPFATALLRIAVAAGMMVAVLYAAHVWMLRLVPGDGMIEQAVRVAAVMAASIVSYIGLCHVFDVEDVASFAALLRRRR